MKTQLIKQKNPGVFIVLTVVSLSACFFLSPLGNFVIWICGGIAFFSLFMVIFRLIPPANKRNPRKVNPREAADKAYIAFHLPIVISLLLMGLLIALIVVFFAT